MEARRPQALEAGLFLLVVALPLAFFPQSRAAFLDVKILIVATGTLLVWASGLPVGGSRRRRSRGRGSSSSRSRRRRFRAAFEFTGCA